ncbi:MAG: hypothetical protein BWK80_20830 [Desulfobacteraceae bacterium IS3]|nr:MAG: hypothetical protein BWK80_20830 [Desulfobacteraceae bacterium IS3]
MFGNMYENLRIVFLITVMTAGIFPVGAEAGRYDRKQYITQNQDVPDKGKRYKGENYQDLSPEEKARLQQKLRKWESMPPEKKEALRNRMDQLKELSPEARELYRKRFNQWQNLSPEERRNVQEKLEKWDSLPPEEKENVRRRFRD